jgi:hypothetical protein
MQAHDGAGAILGFHRRQVDPDKLGRAAADIDDEQLFGARADQRRAGDDGKPRLLLRAMISSCKPVSRRTCRMKSRALRARRQASVATRRMRLTPCFSIFFWQMRSACTVRPIDARLSRPEASRPTPSCTVLEKLSTP